MQRQGQIGKIKKIVAGLMATGKILQLYPTGHPQVGACVNLLLDDLESFLRSEPELVLHITDDEIFFGRELLVEESLNCQWLIKTLVQKNINTLTIRAGVTETEVTDLLLHISLDHDKQGVPARFFAAEPAPHIHLSRLRQERFQGSCGAPTDDVSRGQRYETAIATMETFFDETERGQAVNLPQIKDIVDWLVQNATGNLPALIALTALKNHDEYTCHHSVNVAILSVTLGRKLGLVEEKLFQLGTGALLHDIGKKVIPREIINKPGKLTAEEWQIMKSHPVESAQILTTLDNLEESALIVATEHHLGCDLSGYPEALDKRTPHLFSRIVQLADVYDGLTSDRSYHKAYAPHIAFQHMLSAPPGLLDQTLLRLFVHSLGVYPAGTVVRLSNGQKAVIIDSNGDRPLEPIVKLVEEPDSPAISLTERQDLSIVEVLDPDLSKVKLKDALNAAF